MSGNINKKIVLYLIIMMILMIFIISVLLINVKKSNGKAGGNSLIETEESGEDFIETYGKSENSEIDQQVYFDINSCIKQYLDTININNSIYYAYNEADEYEKIPEKEIKQKILNLLSTEYINKNNITIENLYNNIQVLKESALFVPLEISMVQDAEIKSFLVKGLLQTLGLELIDEIYVVVNIDIEKTIFSMYPIYGEYSSIKDIKNIKCDTQIQENDNNIFTQSKVNYETISKDLINRYKRITITNPELIYNHLNNEYSKKRFDDIKDFKLYVEENRQTIKTLQCTKYYVEPGKDYTRYIIQDQYEKTYIFDVKSLTDFAIILDTYTIDLPDFVKKYNTASAQVKVGMNIEKVLEAINVKDYKYVYDRLDETFKQNNYNTLEKFEQYIKNNFYDNNDIEYLKFTTKGNTYIYEAKLKDNKNTSAKEKELTIIMKLLEGTDFLMSFNIK